MTDSELTPDGPLAGRPPLEAVCDLLTDVGRPMQLEVMHARSCIAATRLAVETLGYFGYPARAVPVRLDVYNPAATVVVDAGEVLTVEHKATGAHIVTTAGTGRIKHKNWDGHLIAFVAAVGAEHAGVMVDLSLDQASRPEHDIAVEPVAFTVGHGWERRVFGVHVNGCAVAYQQIASDGWRSAPDWRNSRAHIGEIIRHLRAQLEGDRSS